MKSYINNRQPDQGGSEKLIHRDNSLSTPIKKVLSLIYFSIHVILSILLGGMIYLLFRHDSLIMFCWVDALGAGEILNEMRDHMRIFSNANGQWIFYSLPDGLWVYSFTSYLIFVWNKHSPLYSFLWLTIPISFSIGGEIGQLLGVIPGTYDGVDIFFCLLGATLPFAFLIPRNSLLLLILRRVRRVR